jgi:hypothetical protein
MTGLFRVVAVVALLAAGCAGKPDSSGLSGAEGVPGTGPSGEAAPTSSAAEAPATSPTAGGAPSTTGGRSTSSATGGPAPAPGGTCAGPPSVRIAAGAAPEPVCLPVNGMLRLTADPSPHQPWGPLVSSNPKILSCTSEPGDAGAVKGVCVPHLPGTVTVSTTTGPFAGDPHGPAQFRWELRVTVVAYGLI